MIGAVIDAFGHRNGTSGDMKPGNISEAVISDWLHVVCLNSFGGQRIFLKWTFNVVQILHSMNRKVRLDNVKSITKLWSKSLLKILKLFSFLPNKSDRLYFWLIFVNNYSLSIFARRAPEYHSEVIHSRLINLGNGINTNLRPDINKLTADTWCEVWKIFSLEVRS